jgi:putative photosynthetic complex assembly protein
MTVIVATGSRLTPTPIVGAGVLLVITLVVVAAWRFSGQSASQEIPAPVVSVRELRFEDRADGGVNVIDVLHAERSQVLPAGSGTDGFLRATLRTLARERHRRGIGSEPPFLLSWRSDGRLMLEDPSTGRQVDLEAFGPTNAQRFARLLDTVPR